MDSGGLLLGVLIALVLIVSAFTATSLTMTPTQVEESGQ